MAEVRRILSALQHGNAIQRKRRFARAAQIEDAIQTRWHVSPWSWKLKHLIWFFDIRAITWSANKRYEAWRNVRAVLAAVGKPHLVTWLENRGNAGYLRPGGVPGRLSETGRPARMVYRNVERPNGKAFSSTPSVPKFRTGPLEAAPALSRRKHARPSCDP
jgi:hypothetical protein